MVAVLQTEGLTKHFGRFKAVQDLSVREGTTPYMTMLTAFLTLLHRYTNQEDLLIGTPIANRNRAETEL